MPDEKLLYQVCPSCGGDKKFDQNVDNPNANDPVEWVEVDCTRCDANGMIPFGELSDDLITILTDMQSPLADIKEKTDEL